MRRLIVLVSLASTAALAGVVWAAAPAFAYGGGAAHDTWQVGISLNCDNPSSPVCQDPNIGIGGFWGWFEFDRSVDGSQTWGDGETAFCFHSVGSGGPFSAGAGHGTVEITSWTVEPGFGGLQTFHVNGTETDSFRGQKITTPLVDEDTQIPATPGHYVASDLLGFTPPPGVNVQIQVAYRPAR